MRKYLYSENGFTEKAEWQPNCWVNVECPDNDDFKFLTEELKVPESFLEDLSLIHIGRAPTYGNRRQLAADHPPHPDAEQPTRRAVHHRTHRHYHQ